MDNNQEKETSEYVGVMEGAKIMGVSHPTFTRLVSKGFLSNGLPPGAKAESDVKRRWDRAYLEWKAEEYKKGRARRERRGLTPEQKENVRDLYLSGESSSSIAARYGVNPNAVRACVPEKDIRKPGRPGIPEAKVARIKDLASKGYTNHRIAKELDISQLTVKKYASGVDAVRKRKKRAPNKGRRKTTEFTATELRCIWAMLSFDTLDEIADELDVSKSYVSTIRQRIRERIQLWKESKNNEAES